MLNLGIPGFLWGLLGVFLGDFWGIFILGIFEFFFFWGVRGLLGVILRIFGIFLDFFGGFFGGVFGVRHGGFFGGCRWVFGGFTGGFRVFFEGDFAWIKHL